jgi:hypothetical protein
MKKKTSVRSTSKQNVEYSKGKPSGQWQVSLLKPEVAGHAGQDLLTPMALLQLWCKV